VTAALRIRVMASGHRAAGGGAGAQSGPIKDQIAQHEQKLAAARDARNPDEATELNVLGFLYRQAVRCKPRWSA